MPNTEPTPPETTAPHRPARDASAFDRSATAPHADSPDGEPLTPDQLVEIERGCDQFEDRLRAGIPADLAEFLARVPGPLRPRLFQELVRLEQRYRHPDAPACLDDYRHRYPEYAGLLAGLTRDDEAAGSSPLGDPASTFVIPSAPVAGDSDTGVSFGPYTLLGRVAAGGMGVVYRARHARLGREVALKMMLGGDQVRPDEMVRFLAEGQAVAAIDHPHVVRVHEFGEHAGRPFLAMEFLTGGTLAQRIEASAPLEPRAAAELVRKIASGVAAAHDLGIVHRDLKPGNVLFDSAGEPKVTDFGLAKRGGGLDLTRTQAVMGTPAYMAPEQAQGGTKFVGPAADVWALGVILYESLTGRRPFTGEGVHGVLQAVIHTDPRTPRAVNPAVPRDLDLIVRKCLEKEPRGRYATASELADDLGRFLRGEPVSVRAAGLLERAYKFARRKPTVAGLYAAMVLGVVMAAVAVGFAMLARELRQAQEKITVIEYGRTIQMAHQAWRDDNVPAALELLESTRPDLRGWEWHYVHRLCHSDLFTIPVVDTSPKGREGPISASFSPDGTRILLGTWIAVRIRDATTGAELLTLPSGGWATFSPDGSRIAVVRDESLVVWDATTGAELFRTPSAGEPLGFAPADFACFSPDGRRILTGRRYSPVVRDATTGEVLSTLGPKWAADDGRVETAAFSPDGKRIVTGASSDFVKVWDTETGAELLAIGGHLDGTKTAVFSPDGSQIVTTCYPRIARVFDANTGKAIHRLEGHASGVTSASYSRDGSKIVTASVDGTARIWDAKTGAELRRFKGHVRGGLIMASFHPDGSRIITAGQDLTVKVWEVNLTPEFLRLKGHAADFQTAEFSPDGSRILTTSWETPDRNRDLVGAARVWDSRTGAELLAIKEFKLRESMLRIPEASFSPDGSRILTAGCRTVGKWSADEWDSRTGKLLRSHPGDGGDYCWASYSPDGSRIVTMDSNGSAKVRIRDANSGAELLALEDRDSFVSGPIYFTPDGSQIVAAGYRRVKVWEAQSGEEVLNYEREDTDYLAVWKSSDGWRAIMNDWEKSDQQSDQRTHIASLRNLDSDERILTLKGHMSSLTSASFSPDRSRIVTSSYDRTVKIWDAKTGAELLTLKGHTDEVMSAKFSPDGSRIVSASNDGTAVIWDSRPISREFLPK